MKRIAGVLAVCALLSISLVLINCGDESTQPCCRVCVVSPNGGEHWTPGETYVLRWCADGPCGPNVRIELYQNGERCATLSESASNCGTFAWVAAGCSDDSTGYRIRVTGVESERYDESDDPFFIAVEPQAECTIALVAPAGGERFLAGQAISIEWTGSAVCCDSVMVELLHNGTPCATLLTDAQRTGTFAWTALPCSSDSTGYAIRVTELCSGATDVSASTFKIVTPQEPPHDLCVLTLADPNGGEEYFAGDPVSIQWSQSGECGGNVRIELLLDDVVCQTLSSSTANDGSFDWIAARCGDADAGYRVRVSDETSGASDASDETFTILAPCVVTLLIPNGGEQWIKGEPATITWETSGACGDSVDLSLARNETACPALARRVPNTGSYTWPATEQCDNEPDGYRLAVSDATSGVSDASDEPFRIVDATVTPNCVLTYLGPADTLPLCPGEPLEIRWSATSDCSPTVRIELVHNGQVCATLAEAADNDGTFLWTATACAGDASGYTLRVTDAANGKSVESPIAFTIRPACAIELTSPTGSEELCAGDALPIAWTSGACCGPEVKIELLQDGAPCRTLAGATPNDGEFTWTAEPCDGTGDYAIRVTDLTTGMSDVTAAGFHVHPTCALTVETPLDGASFCMGETIDVAWTASTCCGPTVVIELLRGGDLYQLLAEAAPNNGSFAFSAALLGPETSAFSIRITEPVSGATDRSEGTFSIWPSCVLTILSPLEAQAYCQGDPIEITWSVSACCGPQVKVELLRDDAVVQLLADATENDGAFTWDATQIDGATDGYTIRVTDLTTGSNDKLDASFQVLPDCALTVTSPSVTGPFCQGQTVDIQWQTSTCCSGPTVRIELLHDGEVCALIEAETANDGTYAWAAEPCPGTADGYAIRVTENASGTTDTSDVLFAIRPGCSLAVTQPVAGGAYCEGTNVPIRWTKSECCGAQVMIELLQAGRVCQTISLATPNDGSYDWSAVPCGDETDGYVIRVTDLTSGTAGVSEASITLNPLCTNSLSYPLNGDLVCKGDDMLITWMKGACCGANVKIALYHYDTFVRNIIASTPNDGEHLWINVQPLSGFINGYAIVITDLTTGRATRGPGDFSIWTGRVTLISPNGGIAYCEGTPVTISWMASPCAARTVKIELLRNNAVCQTIASTTLNDGTLAWNAQRCAGETDGYTIRVTDRDSGLFDESELAFQILPPCAVAVTSPPASTVYCPDDQVTILWAASGECCGVEVRLELLRNDVVCEVIAAATENDGLYTWNASAFAGEGDGYTVRVTALASLISADSPNSFTIAGPCELAVVGPNGGEEVCRGSLVRIAWDYSVCCGESVKLELLRSGVLYATIAEATENDGLFTWDVPPCVDPIPWDDEDPCDGPDGYQIRISAIDGDATDTSDGFFRISNVCWLDLATPVSGSSFCVGDDVMISWHRVACCGPRVKIDLLHNGSLCQPIADSTPNDGTYVWPAALCAGATTGYSVRITDLRTMVADNSPGTFTITPCKAAAAAERDETQ